MNIRPDGAVALHQSLHLRCGRRRAKKHVQLDPEVVGTDHHSFLLPAPGERLQRLLASCPVAVRRCATALVLPMRQSPAPRCSWWRRFGQSDVTNDYIPSEDPVLVSDWAAALEQKVGHAGAIAVGGLSKFQADRI